MKAPLRIVDARHRPYKGERCMTKLMRIMLVVVGINFLIASACVPLQAASAPRRFVIGHAAMNARVAPLWVAEDLGFFAKHGVSVNAIFIRQAPVLVAALTAGDVHAAYTGGTTALTAVAGGADLKIIGSLTNRLGYDMVAAPSIKTPKDLRGKRFGVQTLAGTVWLPCLDWSTWA